MLDTCNEFLLGSVSVTVSAKFGSVKVGLKVGGVGLLVNTFFKTLQQSAEWYNNIYKYHHYIYIYDKTKKIYFLFNFLYYYKFYFVYIK